MRLFLAVPLELSLRAGLTGVQERLKATDADVRWVEPGNLHLTVAFLGDQPEGQLDEIMACVPPVAAATSPFRIGLFGGSAFPKRGPLKTLWVGVNAEGAEAWKSLTRQTEAAFAPLGVPPGNELIPHITLGRVKSERGMDALRAALAAEAQTDCGTQIADRVILVQSFLNPAGATYQELQSWMFTGDAAAAVE